MNQKTHEHGPHCNHDPHEEAHVHGPHCSHAQEPVRNPLKDIGRNDPCPCGSGAKYKKCHGA